MTGAAASRAPGAADRALGRWLRCSAAFVWLATGLLVLHPYYRAIGSEYLARLHVPSGFMYAACAVEVVLGLRVALGDAGTTVTLVQILAILGFSAVLAWEEPLLLASPFGVLSKNLPLMAVIASAWLLEREGWGHRTEWLLRGGVGLLWIAEGLVPKILFQQPFERTVVADSGLVPFDAGVFLTGLGVCEVIAGVLTLSLRGRLLRYLLSIEIALLIALPVFVAWQHPYLCVHPFGPLTKNAPLLAGTWVLWQRSDPRRVANETSPQH